jgi:hypothetical protein
MKRSILYFNNISLKPFQIPKFRGYIGNIFKDCDLFHNHNNEGKLINRYPLIQYKIINGTPLMVAVNPLKAIKVS